MCIVNIEWCGVNTGNKALAGVISLRSNLRAIVLRKLLRLGYHEVLFRKLLLKIKAPDETYLMYILRNPPVVQHHVMGFQ